MKAWIILTVIAVAITAAGTLAVPYLATSSPLGPEFPAPAKPDGPAPKLVIDENLTYKFDVMAKYTDGHHGWLFKNEGPGVLELRGSGSTCSCTTSDLFEGADKKSGKLIKIEPGQSKLITVSWETKNWNDFRQTVTVGTNDPDRPEIKLNVEGTVRPAIVTNPSDLSISFANVGNDEPSLRRMVLYSPDRPDMKILKVISSTPERLGAEAKPFTPEDIARLKVEKGFVIEVTLKPTATLGEFFDEIVIETDHPLQKSLTLKVKGTVTGPITVMPSKITVRDATSSDGGSESLTIWARGRTSVNFTVAKQPPGFDVVIEPLAAMAGVKGSKYKMTVKVAPGLESGLIDDEILIKSDDPKASEIHVPLSVLIKGSR